MFKPALEGSQFISKSRRKIKIFNLDSHSDQTEQGVKGKTFYRTVHQF